MDREFRRITGHIDIQSDIQKVWNAWTTELGAVTFFAPRAKIEAHPGGAYELYFNTGAPEGLRGSEGMQVLAVEPGKFLSFTWNAPPHLPTVRGQMTFVEIHLEELESGITRVHLQHSGWGNEGEWDSAFAYFERAWLKIVLPRLKFALEQGAVDWSNPPAL